MKKVKKVNPKLIPEVNVGVVGHVGHGKCLELKMPVLLNNSVSTGKELLRDLRFNGEVFLEEDEIKVYTLADDGKIRSGIAKRYFEEYHGKLIRITTQSGRWVEVSPNHPFLVNKKGELEWKRAEELKEGDEILVLGKFKPREDLEKVEREIEFEKVVREFVAGREGEWIILRFGNGKKCKVKPFRIDENFVKLLAFINAEGHLTPTKLMLSQKKERSMLNEVLRYLKSLGYSYRCYSSKDYVIKPVIIAKYFSRILKGSSKNLRGWILCLPKRLKRLYLRWFFSLEGHVNLNARGIEVVQESSNLLNYLLLLLYEFDIFPKIGRKRVKGKSYYRLWLYGKDAERFLKEIGIEGKNQSRTLKLLETLKNSETKLKTYRSISLRKEILDELVDVLKDEKKIGRGIKKSRIYRALEEARKKERITEELLERLIKKVEKAIEKLEEADLVKVLPLNKVARWNGIPPTSFRRMIRRNDRRALRLLEVYRREKVERARKVVRKLKRLFLEELRTERIKEIKTKRFEGIIYDLHVPETHTFFGGVGFILLHNTTLTKALTGKLTLQHSEELRRGITIRLGYADATFYRCKNGHYFSLSEKCPYCFEDGEVLRTVSFLDAPGHETLMATVLTGTALMDGAILVIAANHPCPQPQTREHLKALELSGIKNVVVVQNKIDLVSEEEAIKNYEQIKEFLKESPIKDAPIIPVSAQHNVNVDLLIKAIEEKIPTPHRDETKPFRMLVARSFDVNKPGIGPDKIVGGVLGGAILQGKVHLGDEVEIRPGIKVGDVYKPLVTKVCGLQKAGIDLEEAGPGGLLGMMTELDPSLTKSDALVGNVVGFPGELPEVRYELELEIHLLERIVGAEDLKEVEPIKKGENILINVGTARSLGRVEELKGEKIKLILRIPVCAEIGERVTVSRLVNNRWRLVGYGNIL